jgi:hypothetical protein
MNSTQTQSSFNKMFLGKSGADRRTYLYTTGFLRKEYIFEASKKHAPTVLDVDFMRNWTYSWNFLVLQSEKKPTSFQAVSPLLNACITIFFDRSLLRLVTVLSIYSMACDIATYWSYHEDSWYYISNVFVIFVLLFSVWQGYYVLKGVKPVVVSNRNYKRNVVLTSNLTVSGSIKFIGRYFMGYLASLSVKSRIDENEEDFERKVRKSGDYQIEGFLEVCHATTEYLLSVGSSYDWLKSSDEANPQQDVENGIAMQNVEVTKPKSGMSVSFGSRRNFSDRPNRGSVIDAAPEVIIAMPSFPVFHPRRYTNIVIVVSIILFPLCFLCNCLMGAVYYLPKCESNQADLLPQPQCHSLRLYGHLSLWFAIPNFVYTYLTVSLAVVLSSLLYGADLANALAVNWNLRFLPLRRTGHSDRLVVPEGTEDDVPDEADKEFDAFCARFNNQSIMDILRDSVHINADGSTNNGMRGTFARNSQHLRDSVMRYSQSGQNEDLRKSVSWAKLVSLMNRDATERYLFMQQYFNVCSEVWSPYLGTCIVGCASTFVFNYGIMIYIFFTHNQLAAAALFLVLSSILVFVVMLVSLSYANAAADAVWKSFNGAGKDDFEIMGGRDAWKEYVSGAPIQWTVFGVAVTRKMLVSSTVYLVSLVVSSVFVSFLSNAGSGSDSLEGV